MQKTIRLLSTCFIVQLFLAVGLFTWNSSQTHQYSEQVVFADDLSDIDEIIISDNKTDILIKKSLNNWVLPEHNNLPVDKSKYQSLISKLSDIKLSWPVSTSSTSIKRFEVANDNYQKKITLKSNGDIKDVLYLGTSPSFKKVHARLNEQTEVYAVNFNNYDAPVEFKSWFDNTLLSVKEQPKEIKTSSYQLVNQNGMWVVPNKKNGKVEKQDVLRDIVSTVTNIKAEDIAKKEEVQKIKNTKPATLIEVTTDNINKKYELYKLKEKTFIRAGGDNNYFKVNSELSKKANLKTSDLLQEIKSTSNTEEKEVKNKTS